MIVLEDCPRCGEVATHVSDAEFERQERLRERLVAMGVQCPRLWSHHCPAWDDFEPIRLRPRWLAWLLRWFSYPSDQVPSVPTPTEEGTPDE